MERYPSGQRDQTVNLTAYVFEGSNPSLSTIFDRESTQVCNPRVMRKVDARGYSKNGEIIKGRIRNGSCQ
jgi:hypothetical protein